MRRPSLPVPVSPETSMRRSSAILRTAGDKGWTGRLDGAGCGLDRGLDGWPGGRRCGCLARLGHRGGGSAVGDGTEDGADIHGLAGPDGDRLEDAGGRRRHFDGHLVGLELDHRFVGLDGLAFLLEPLADRRLGDRLAERPAP